MAGTRARADHVSFHQAQYRNGFVRSDVVPDHDDPATDVAEQMPEEHENLCGRDCPRTDISPAIRALQTKRRNLSDNRSNFMLLFLP